jgi:hypothetical protein
VTVGADSTVWAECSVTVGADSTVWAECSLTVRADGTVWAEGSVTVGADSVSAACALGEWRGKGNIFFLKIESKPRRQYNIKTDLNIFISSLLVYKFNDSTDRFLLFGLMFLFQLYRFCRSEILCKSGGILNLF